MEAAFGACPPTREIVERHRAGDAEAAAHLRRALRVRRRRRRQLRPLPGEVQPADRGVVDARRGRGPEEIAREVGAFADGDPGRPPAPGHHLRGAAVHARPGPVDAVRPRRARHPPRRVQPRRRHHRRAPGAVAAPVGPVGGVGPRAGARARPDRRGPHRRRLLLRRGGPSPEGQGRLLRAPSPSSTSSTPTRALAILYHVGESFRDKSLESSVRWVQEAAELGAHRLGHAIALGVDPAAFGPHTRPEPVSERRDQIAYDLAHADGLAAAGVRVDAAALDAERRALAGATGRRAADDDLRRRPARRGAAAPGLRDGARAVDGRGRRGVPHVEPAHRRHRRRRPTTRSTASSPPGLPVVVSSDDPGIFGTTLADELAWVCEQTGGGDDLRRQLVGGVVGQPLRGADGSPPPVGSAASAVVITQGEPPWPGTSRPSRSSRRSSSGCAASCARRSSRSRRSTSTTTRSGASPIR